MLTTPEIVDRDSLPYIALRRSVPMGAIGEIAPATHDLVLDFVRDAGAEPGAPFIKYNVIDMEGLMELEFGVLLTDAIEPTGEFLVSELPAGRYATVTHTGSYDELYDVTSLLVGWAKERGVAWDSAPEGVGERFVSRVELYLNDPADVAPEQLVTRLDFKVREASTSA